MNIPAHDLKTQYESIREEIDEAIQDVKNNTDFILGDAVEQFEQAFADYCETEHCVGVSSGTAALRLLYEAIDLEDNDEVITTPFTFVATVEPLLHMGVKPVFADIDPETYNLDPASVEKKITSNTRAIVAVHLYGQPSHFDELRDLADQNDLVLIEDAAQSHGARWKNQRTGSLGDAAAFSFYPGKNLGAFGDAGGITTADDEIAERLRSLRDHGRTEKYAHAEPAFNHRMDGIQGAVLDVKLKHLDDWNEARRSNARYYNEALEDEPVRTPVRARNAEHVYHQYTLRVRHRDDVRTLLNDANIGAGVYYPKPLHLQPSLDELDVSKGDLPVAEEAANQVLSLPVHSMLSDEEREYVVDTLVDALDQTHTSSERNDNFAETL